MHINYDADLSHGHFLELGMSTINFDTERQKRLDDWKKKKKEEDHD
jgi:hypothetical protein